MFDFSNVALILAGFGGLSVVGVTEMLKVFLKAKGAVAVILSVIVSAGFTAYYLLAVAPPFAFLPFAGYTALVALTANGIFKGLHTPSNPTP